MTDVIAFIRFDKLMDASNVWWARYPQGFPRGEPAYSIQVTSDINAVWGVDTPEYYAFSWTQCPQDAIDMQLEWLAGNMGTPSTGEWGDGTNISLADAIAATAGDVMQVYQASGDVEPIDHFNAICAARGMHRLEPVGP